MTAKYYIPSMMLTLPTAMAEDILSNGENSVLRCGCRFCQGSYRNLGRIAKVHFLDTRSGEVNRLNNLPDNAARVAWFSERVDVAIRACENVRKQQIVNLQPAQYSHLRTWLQVFSS